MIDRSNSPPPTWVGTVPACGYTRVHAGTLMPQAGTRAATRRGPARLPGGDPPSLRHDDII